MVEPEDVLAALGVEPGSPYEVEPLGDLPGSPQRWISGGHAAIVRESADREAARNHLAIMQALARERFDGAPHLLGVSGMAAIEEELPAATALQLTPPPGAAERAMRVLADFHQLAIREGANWGRSPVDLYPPGEVPLHRLGFSSAERGPTAAPLQQALETLWTTPFGLAHNRAWAANVLLGNNRAWLVDFGRAGLGAQLVDVAAFLLTSGIAPAGRRALAAVYGEARGLGPEETADDVDLVGILWGLDELLGLPRRLIEALGDDALSEALRLAGARIERGVRAPAGGSLVAAQVRAALWGE